MLPGVRSVRPGPGEGEGGSAAAWTGEKRRKTTHPPPVGTSDDDADAMMDVVQLQDPPEEDGSRVFSAEDVITDEELAPYLRQMPTLPTIRFTYHLLSVEELVEMNERFYRLRIQDYRSLKMCKLDGDTSIAVAPTDPNMSCAPFDEWSDDPQTDCIFDWTIPHQHFFQLAELTDYQRIVPTRSLYDDYLDWEGYCTTLSSYETDEDYVKYIDELSKKVKWIGEHMHLDEDDIEFLKLKDRAYNQAMKIAAGLSHLPINLAIRGYKMGFRQALEEIHAANMFPSQRCRIEFEMYVGVMQMQFNTFMSRMPENVRVKTYVDYARKKLEIGRRLQMFHYGRQTHSIISTE
ncbi:hypothetical protein U9M48_037867 [Paspalum notatum var. saurae]|uniref:Uncharacterized protein n=1 Tax=Paspalum notatum var. saurae TaxID=547442 RepID=A0AAQ3UM60_PASNO